MDNNLENEKECSFKKVTHLPNNYFNNNNLLNNFRNTKNKYTSKRVKIILPNLSKSTIINNNKDNEKVNNNNNIKDYISKEGIDKKINKNLNKSISFPNFPSLKKQKILNKNKINDFNRNYNKSVYSQNYYPNSLLNLNNLRSRQINRNNLFNKNFGGKSSTNRDTRNISLKLNKNNDILKSLNYNKENKKLTNSTFKISKICLNETSFDRKLFKKINTSLSCKNSTLFRNNDSVVGPKYSKFFKISQNDGISAQRIYRHYLKKSRAEIIKPIRNYKQFFDDRSKTFLEKLSRIYGQNPNFVSIIREIKDNNKIAYKDDFNIEEYQSTIIELMNQRISQKYLLDLQNDYRSLNKKLNGVVEPKGRFTILADKLKYNLPLYLLEKLKQLDKDTILSRMRYYSKFKKFKSEKKLVKRFKSQKQKKV